MKASDPVAARLPAEPGWHYVVVRRTGVRDSATREKVEIRCYPLTTWGVPPPQMERAFGTPGDTVAFNAAPHLWPLDDGGRFVDASTLVGKGVYGPSLSSTDALADAQRQIAAELDAWNRAQAKSAPA